MKEDKTEDEDLELDFSWMKKIFKGKKDQVKQVESQAEQLEKDIKHRESDSPQDPTKLKEEENKVKEIEKDTKVLEKSATQIDKSSTQFDKKLEEQEAKLEQVEEEVDEEIDWGKVSSGIKGFWKKGKTAFSQEDDNDINVDWKRASAILKKYHVLLLILIPLLVSIYFRSLPATLPITDNWAISSVDSNILNQIRNQVNQNYPNLPDQNKDVLVNEELIKFRIENKDAYEAQIKSTSEFFKSRLQNDNGQTYLIAIDPWFWYRHARNIVENGHPGDKLVDGKQIDDHMLAPRGREVPPDKFHAYLEAYSYNFLKIFNKDLDLLTVAFFLPMIIASLAIIPAFFIAKKIGGNFGGIIASLIVALHPSVMSRTTAGFSDTDAYNIFFPLFITWFFLLALDAKDNKKMIAYSIAAAFSTGLYAYAWSGWWHIFHFLLISSILIILYLIVIHRSSIKNNLKGFITSDTFKKPLIILLLFLIGTIIFVSLFTFYGVVKSGFISPFGFSQIKEVGISSAYPNVFTTVAEQNEVNLPGIISQFGGKLLFYLALIGITLTLWSTKNKKLHEITYLIVSALYYLVVVNYFAVDPTTFMVLIIIPIAIKIFWAMYKKDESIDIKYSTILIIWLIATIFAATKGIRWVLLGAAPLGIAIGITLGLTLKNGTRYLNKEFKINKIISMVVLIIILLLVIGIAPFPPFCKFGICASGKNTAFHEVPSMNDAWYNTLDKINREATHDAIINSWWDFGHWFKAIGDRAVTFDGTTQNTPMAHFVGNALLNDDEQQAIGTLRMLDCGSSSAVERLETYLGRTYKAIELLRSVYSLDRAAALKVYQNTILTPEQIDEVIELTHCDPPENYFITSQDMVGKSGVWAHFGIWDFRKATMYNQVYGAEKNPSIELLTSEFNMTKEDASSLYFEIQTIDPNRDSNTWIAPWPSYSSGVDGCQKEGNQLTCVNNFKIDLDTHHAEVLTAEGIRHPRRLTIITKEGLIQKDYTENFISLSNGRPLGLAIIPTDTEGTNYATLFQDFNLAGSMFTRLFYMDGHGLECFEKFDQQTSTFGTKIITWKVNWDCNTNRKVYLQVPELAPVSTPLNDTVEEEPANESAA
tara:strand:+ start:7236 stop:10538 length:3303 start_codon:yes stop_codon:yes gene_type:complete